MSTPRRRSTDRLVRVPTRRTLAMVAWVVMVAWVSLLSYNGTQADKEIRAADRAGRLVACRVLNKDRATQRASTVGFGELLVASSPPKPGETPTEAAERAVLVEAFRERIRQQTAELAVPIPCSSFVDDPEKYLDEEAPGP